MESNQINSYTENKNYNFTIVENDLIRNSDLSCKAFKLLCIGLSHNQGWNFNKAQISTCFKEGLHTVDEAMKELRKLGYLHLRPKTKQDGKFQGHFWHWFHKPISNEEFKKYLRNMDFPEDRKSGLSENRPDIRRTNNKKKKDYKNNNKSDSVISKKDVTKETPTGVVVVSSEKEKIPEKVPIPIPDCLDKITEIRDDLKNSIVAQYSVEAIETACACINENTLSKPATLLTALKQRWVPTQSRSSKEGTNLSFLQKLMRWDGLAVSVYTLQVSPTYVLFAHASGSCPTFTIEQPDFIQSVKSFLYRLCPEMLKKLE